MDCLYTINSKNLLSLDDTIKKNATLSLESGQSIFFPDYSFTLTPEEHPLLSEHILKPKHKNISYDITKQKLAGLRTPHQPGTLPATTQAFMHRFALFSKNMIDQVLPQYTSAIHWGRTSYRPAEIKGRVTSKRKDDTRVHVDSFAATPVNGLRILRVFCNINPNNEPRVWHIGEPFSQVLNHFAASIPAYNLIQAKLLKLVKTTKTLRTAYDHYMLHLHDQMKLDDNYQETLRKQRVDFPANSSWIVFTDHVSHAALSGQYLLEQTFYLPCDAMLNPELSPLEQWKNRVGI